MAYQARDNPVATQWILNEDQTWTAEQGVGSRQAETGA